MPDAAARSVVAASGGVLRDLISIAVADRPSVASSLHAEMEQLRGPEERPPVVATIGSVGGLFKAVHAHPRGTMIVIGAEVFSTDHWRRLDANRTRLMRNDITVLILDEASAARLENIAPNLASWVGGRVWRLADDAAAPVLSPSELRSANGRLTSR